MLECHWSIPNPPFSARNPFLSPSTDTPQDGSLHNTEFRSLVKHRAGNDTCCCCRSCFCRCRNQSLSTRATVSVRGRSLNSPYSSFFRCPYLFEKRVWVSCQDRLYRDGGSSPGAKIKKEHSTAQNLAQFFSLKTPIFFKKKYGKCECEKLFPISSTVLLRK